MSRSSHLQTRIDSLEAVLCNLGLRLTVLESEVARLNRSREDQGKLLDHIVRYLDKMRHDAGNPSRQQAKEAPLQKETRGNCRIIKFSS